MDHGSERDSIPDTEKAAAPHIISYCLFANGPRCIYPSPSIILSLSAWPRLCASPVAVLQSINKTVNKALLCASHTVRHPGNDNVGRKMKQIGPLLIVLLIGFLIGLPASIT